MSDSTSAEYKDGVLTVTRLYNAPRADVFDAWMNTQKMNQWYGPEGTVEVKSDIEANMGGKYAHEMIFEGGRVHKSQGTIIEYDPPSAFAYRSEGPGPDDVMTIRVEFIEQGSNTLVRLTHKGVTEQMAQFVSPAWSGAFDKLAGFLQSS
ncbi:MAG TPA: hypothetical protein ENK61_00145 [Devosia sp.]|nr:hypothetical protein [Devosia sp.]